MLDSYSDFADDHYINVNLNTEMDLSGTREAILHYAEQLQKKYPEMRNFYSREQGNYVLEEDKDSGSYRWCSVELRRICTGYVNPPSINEALDQHRSALDLAPYTLSLSPLDCEALDFLVGFDFTYRGNQNQLVAEALGVHPAFERLTDLPGGKFINNEPIMTLAMDDECRVQCRVGIEPRTNAYQIRTGEYQEEQLSVYVTARRYGSIESGVSFVEAMDDLAKLAQDIVENYVADSVLDPLARAIALG